MSVGVPHLHLFVNKNKTQTHMKTKSLFLAALVIFGSAAAFAGKEEPRKTGLVVIPVKGSETFKVIYRGEFPGSVKLNVYDRSGSRVLTESISGLNGFILPLNFTGLAFGEYTVEVVDFSGKKTEKIVHRAEQSKKAATNMHISKIGREEARFLLSVAGNASGVINVKIFDEADNLLHDEDNAIAGDFAKIYKIAVRSSGYRFEVTDASGNTKVMKF